MIGRRGSILERSREAAERLALHTLDALLVTPDRECPAEEQRQDPAAQERVVRDLAVRLSKRGSALWRECAPVEDEVDPRVVAAEVDPVDDRRRLAALVDEQVTQVEVSVDDDGRRRLLEALGGVDDVMRLSGCRPDPQALELREALPRLRDAEGHVGSPDRVRGQVGVELDGVERTQERAQRPAEADARLLVQVGVRELPAREERRAVEGPPEGL